jgi:ubiquinone/menaquinone biosynthesis C-methylase UbiE
MSAIAASVQKFAKPFHVRLRASRCSMAASIMCPDPSLSLLDVGGSPGFSGEFNQMRSRFGRVTVVNLDARTNRNLIAPNVTVETADGCNLPYEDKSFDWAFSNAVLEHVGDFEKQRKFAAELQRVARVDIFFPLQTERSSSIPTLTCPTITDYRHPPSGSPSIYPWD